MCAVSDGAFYPMRVKSASAAGNNGSQFIIGRAVRTEKLGS
jgi:hypothetical protein